MRNIGGAWPQFWQKSVLQSVIQAGEFRTDGVPVPLFPWTGRSQMERSPMGMGVSDDRTLLSLIAGSERRKDGNEPSIAGVRLPLDNCAV